MFNICHKLMTDFETLSCVRAHMQDNGFTFSHDYLTGDLP